LSESTVRRLDLEGRFPAPEELTPGRVVFAEAAVEAAMERLLGERRAARGASPEAA
jgi:predicted DNA-binding transcriptional regulator AlpA